MNRMVSYLMRILALAFLWGLGGYLIGFSFQVLLDISYPISNILASLNLIFGMLLFLGITRDPTAERIFFEGPLPDEDGMPAIGCLWGMPLVLILLGVWWIIQAFFMRFIFPP